jgi:hypothetical protein
VPTVNEAEATAQHAMGGQLTMLFSDNQHRTVMDRIASTVVIKK